MTGHRGEGRRRTSRKSSSGSNQGLLTGLAIGAGGVGLLAAVLVGVMLGLKSAPPPASVSSTVERPPAVVSPTPIADGSETLPPPVAAPAVASIPSPSVVEDSNPPSSERLSLPAAAGPPVVTRTELLLPDLIEQVERSVVRIAVEAEQGEAIGSGFVVGREGAVLTNYHVIEGAASAVVQFRDGTKAAVTGVLKLDDQRDLAVVKIDLPADRLVPLPLANDLPRKGEKVAAFGAPQGLSFSASEGIVSAVRPAEEVDQAAGTYIQTTAAISGGNSGGPLVNMFGEVVGANTFKRRDGENLNFAISSDDVRDVVNSRGTRLIALSPETVPVKIAGGHDGAENLVGTERGRLLLSRIKEAAIVIAPFNYDPTGKITDYVELNAERTFEGRLRWKRVTQSREMKPSTAVVIMTMYFSLTEGAERDGVSDLNVHMVILARDVDKNGRGYTAIVWDERDVVGTTSLNNLRNGSISRTIENGVRNYFTKLVSTYRKATAGL